jgi:protein-S-isoprenylcysteine O-methyltransferase Ste14
MSDSDFETWGRLRRMGSVRFVLGIGCIGFGVPFAILFSLLFCLAIWAMGDPSPPLWWFVLTAALSLLGGLAFGFWQWYTTERAYQRRASSGTPAEPAGE